jgi:hypothetical protein
MPMAEAKNQQKRRVSRIPQIYRVGSTRVCYWKIRGKYLIASSSEPMFMPHAPYVACDPQLPKPGFQRVTNGGDWPEFPSCRAPGYEKTLDATNAMESAVT